MDLLDVFGEDEDYTTEDAPTKPEEPEKNIAHEFRADLLDWLVAGKIDPPRAGGLHCSSLWKTCARVPLLEAKYAAYIRIEPNSAGQQMTYDVGHALHDLIQNKYVGPFGRLWGEWKCLPCREITHKGLMPKACPKCEAPWRDDADGIQNIVYSEMFVKDDTLDYCGHCDGILLSRRGKKAVFEFKTISKSQYGGLRAPKPEHVIQVHAYMASLGLDEAVILYWDKGSQADWRKLSDGTWSCTNPHLKVFGVQFDSTIWGGVSVRIRDYHKAEDMVKRLPTIEIEHINQFTKICSHKKCDLACDCHVRDLCFAI